MVGPGNATLGARLTIHDGVLILRPEMVDIDDSARIDSMVKIEGGLGVHIGKGVHVSSFAHLNIGGGSLTIHNYAALTSGVRVVTGSNTEAGQSMSSASPPEMQVIERKSIVIGEYAFIGAGATILPGAHIGQYAIVGAGAVVTKPVPAYTVWMGIPARMVGRRVRLQNGTYGISYFGKGAELVETMEAMYP